MRQYLDTKQQNPDSILFFRMGDFYEMFYEDALTASRALDLTLTSRAKDNDGSSIPMCGIPHHAADTYVTRLVKKGFRVAICDQVEDAKSAKGLIRREVVRVVSSGTLTSTDYLDARTPAFLMALFVSQTSQSTRSTTTTRQSVATRHDSTCFGVALLDLSTGEFSSTEYDGTVGSGAIAEEIAVLQPREILVPDNLDLGRLLPEVNIATPITTVQAWTFETERAQQTLLEQLHVASLNGFGFDGRHAAISAAGALIRYLRDTQKRDLTHVRRLSFRPTSDHLVVDSTTLKHLEIVNSLQNQRDGSLLDTVDSSITAMGGRQLRRWLLKPLITLERIQERLDAVEDFAYQTVVRLKLREQLRDIADLERLVGRVALGSAGPRELLALQQSATTIPKIRQQVDQLKAPLIQSLLAELDDLTDIRTVIESTIANDPPIQVRDGNVIRDGVDKELDELRTISQSGRQNIAAMEQAERSRTGISTLKIKYNRVFGYYIEVSKANLNAVPADYHRKQTIANGERYITPALKEYEKKVLSADEQITDREAALYEDLLKSVASEAPRIQDTANALAKLDTLAAFAETATVFDYTKPQIQEVGDFEALEVRHPMVERLRSNEFVPNDVLLNDSTHQLIILTGPNMGGKSTFLRQTALLPILAQAGSFVPARQAKLSVVDRIFARVGASDNISQGQSTFMVEMEETANILHTATSRSLVLLDEVGRGTSTFDGLSIAWAVVEYLATHASIRPSTLFATHYHELTDLADALPGVVNYHVEAREYKDELTFLRKVIKGRSDRSYGIQVAKLAGLPDSVVKRAREVLTSLEADELKRSGRPALSDTQNAPQAQLGLFRDVKPIDKFEQKLREIDLDQLTPLDALTILTKLKKDTDG